MRRKHDRYFEFWIISSRGTDETTIRRYTPDTPLDKGSLKSDVEEWVKCFAATQVSENCYSYGWREIKGKDLPRNRTEALKRHDRACEIYRKAKNASRRAAKLLAVYPFNGAIFE